MTHHRWPGLRVTRGLVLCEPLPGNYALTLFRMGDTSHRDALVSSVKPDASHYALFVRFFRAGSLVLPWASLHPLSLAYAYRGLMTDPLANDSHALKNTLSRAMRAFRLP